MNTAILIGIVLLSIVVVPYLIFVCVYTAVKVGTYAFYEGRYKFFRDHLSKEKRNGEER